MREGIKILIHLIIFYIKSKKICSLTTSLKLVAWPD